MSVFSNKGTDDKLLLSQLREGNTDAYRALYQKYWEQVYNHIYKRLKDDCKPFYVKRRLIFY